MNNKHTFTEAEENTVKYKFLDLKPSPKDEYEGKSHEKVANAVVECIKNHEKIKIVGLEGDWGSGKSTVVKIIENKLKEEKEKKYIFFTYDSWENQTENIKISFLQELCSYIGENYANLKIKLSKTIDTNFSKKYIFDSFIPIFVIYFIIKPKDTYVSITYLYYSLILIFNILIFNDLKKISKIRIPLLLALNVIGIPLLLALIPLLLTSNIIRLTDIYYFGVLLVLLYRSIKTMIKFKNIVYGLKKTLIDLFIIFKKEGDEYTETKLIYEEAPLNKNLKKWLEGIDKKLKNENQELIITLDNIDRLNEEKVKEIWSIIHMLFTIEKTEYNTTQNIKVIVPFDIKKIEDVFKKENKEENYARDYIEKTFNITFRVTKPIHSNWEKLFEKYWDEAFKLEKDKSEMKECQIIYEDYVENYIENYTITPRNIKAFINKLISLKLIHEDILLQYISVFILNKDEILNNTDKIFKENKYDINYKTNRYDMLKSLIALKYQISKEDSKEVFYEEELKSLLNIDENKKSFDSKKISEIKDKSKNYNSELEYEIDDYILNNISLKSDIFLKKLQYEYYNYIMMKVFKKMPFINRRVLILYFDISENNENNQNYIDIIYKDYNNNGELSIKKPLTKDKVKLFKMLNNEDMLEMLKKYLGHRIIKIYEKKDENNELDKSDLIVEECIELDELYEFCDKNKYVKIYHELIAIDVILNIIRNRKSKQVNDIIEDEDELINIIPIIMYYIDFDKCIDYLLERKEDKNFKKLTKKILKYEFEINKNYKSLIKVISKFEEISSYLEKGNRELFNIILNNENIKYIKENEINLLLENMGTRYFELARDNKDYNELAKESYCKVEEYLYKLNKGELEKIIESNSIELELLDKIVEDDRLKDILLKISEKYFDKFLSLLEKVKDFPIYGTKEVQYYKILKKLRKKHEEVYKNK